MIKFFGEKHYTLCYRSDPFCRNLDVMLFVNYCTFHKYANKICLTNNILSLSKEIDKKLRIKCIVNVHAIPNKFMTCMLLGLKIE